MRFKGAKAFLVNETIAVDETFALGSREVIKGGSGFHAFASVTCESWDYYG